MAWPEKHGPVDVAGAVDARATCTDIDKPPLKRRRLDVLPHRAVTTTPKDQTEIGWTHAAGCVGRTEAVASYDPNTPSAHPPSGASTPTQDQYEQFQFLHRYFNERLGLLVQPAMLAFSRKAKAFGYFAPERWRKDSDENTRVSEIALNPDCLSHEPREVAATIAHEMIHQWQHEHGSKKSRSGYHNAEWGAKMESVGLMPSATGEAGGKKTGAKMSNYVIDGGAFARAFADLPTGALLPFVSGLPPVKGDRLPPGPRKPKDPSKTPFICGGGCKAKMWGKPSLRAVCKECGADFVRADGGPRENTTSEDATDG